MTRNAPNYKKEETEGRSLHEVRGRLILTLTSYIYIHVPNEVRGKLIHIYVYMRGKLTLSLTLTLTLTLALALTLNPALTQP